MPVTFPVPSTQQAQEHRGAPGVFRGNIGLDGAGRGGACHLRTVDLFVNGAGDDGGGKIALCASARRSMKATATEASATAAVTAITAAERRLFCGRCSLFATLRLPSVHHSIAAAGEPLLLNGRSVKRHSFRLTVLHRHRLRAVGVPP